MLESVAAALRTEAEWTNERRLLVLSGGETDRFDAAARALSSAGIESNRTTLVGHENGLSCEHRKPARADALLGTTREAVVVDCHDECRPNVLGRIVGSVNGGGLLILLTPPLDEWPMRRDAFDATLAVPPAGVKSVTGRFRRRLVRTLRAHPGIAIVDLDAPAVLDDGLTHPAPRKPPDPISLPNQTTFPEAAYDACVTQDQATALQTFESLQSAPASVVVSADRGRGKSSAAGLAAASFATEGEDVLVTAPSLHNASEVFARAEELLDRIGSRAYDPEGVGPDDVDPDGKRRVDTTAGGCIRFERPVEAARRANEPDVVIVDEAAALPVRLLSDLLASDRIAFATTVHGYEGTGRGFDVRFRDRLDASDHDVREVTLSEPIRYASGDPIEVWAFRALLLDASPAVDPLVTEATPETVSYRTISPADLIADEHLLGEVFGLLVYAHYRTEPDDLARLLDAPNLSVRALCFEGHVVSVALLAEEGGLDAETRADVYTGGRIRGNMLPDVLMSQLRDEDAGEPIGIRVVRIATHHAVRSRGLGSRLLSEIREEFEDDVDWIGAGFGATPALIRFWEHNGFGTVHLATTRNESSGEYSILVLDPTSERGAKLARTHARWFARRILDVLADALSDMDPDVVRSSLRACPATAPLELSEENWRLVGAAAFGPALYSVDPEPFRRLAAHHLTSEDDGLLNARQERLLVRKLLQLRPWPTVAAELDFVSPSEAMRALGEAFQPLVEAYGSDVALDEAARFRSS